MTAVGIDVGKVNLDLMIEGKIEVARYPKTAAGVTKTGVRARFPQYLALPPFLPPETSPATPQSIGGKRGDTSGPEPFFSSNPRTRIVQKSPNTSFPNFRLD